MRLPMPVGLVATGDGRFNIGTQPALICAAELRLIASYSRTMGGRALFDLVTVGRTTGSVGGWRKEARRPWAAVDAATPSVLVRELNGERQRESVIGSRERGPRQHGVSRASSCVQLLHEGVQNRTIRGHAC
jgi:hypothetical protein